MELGDKVAQNDRTLTEMKVLCEEDSIVAELSCYGGGRELVSRPLTAPAAPAAPGPEVVEEVIADKMVKYNEVVEVIHKVRRARGRGCDL